MIKNISNDIGAFAFRVDVGMRYVYKIHAKNLLEAEEKMAEIDDEEIFKNGIQRDAPETYFDFWEAY